MLTLRPAITYVLLFHRHDMAMGVRSAVKGIKQAFNKRAAVAEDDEDDLSEDIHFRLMKRYPEVPEWWFGILLLIAMAIGMVSVGAYPTHTSPSVVIYGIIMPLIAILPCGYVQAVTGVAIPLQVLAQFIGGAFSGGNGVALMFFKVSHRVLCDVGANDAQSYGYISMYQALLFCNDLKLAHYIKIPPRHTFVCQIAATLIVSRRSSHCTWKALTQLEHIYRCRHLQFPDELPWRLHTGGFFQVHVCVTD